MYTPLQYAVKCEPSGQVSQYANTLPPPPFLVLPDAQTLQMVQLLVEELGCLVDARGWIQATPLHLACRGTRTQAIEVLLANGR
jgi:ankyrin repeat protein